MAIYRLEYIDPILFVRYFAPPDAQAVVELTAHAAEMSQKHKKKLHTVILVGEGLPIPNADQRAALKQLLANLEPYLHCNRLVFEGSSVKATMQRTIVDAAQILARLKGSIITVHATGAEAITAIMKEMQLPADYLIMKAKNAKVY